MIRLAICQMRTELSQTESLEKARLMVEEAAAAGADFVVLPEMFNCPYSKEYFKKYAALGHRESVEAMSAWAKKLNIYLVGGSIPETADGKIYNTCFVFGRNGEQLARHRKLHLFDVDIPGMRFRESSTFSPGDEITVFQTEYGLMGCAVCFDVRFPELFRAMAMRGARLIFLPAQFSTRTGPAHWEMTLRMRAVDNEVFFAAAAAARYPGFDYECWGHSMIVDPYARILAEADETEQIIYSDIDFKTVDEVRQQLPTFLKLRKDLYRVAE